MITYLHALKSALFNRQKNINKKLLPDRVAWVIYKELNQTKS